MSINRIKINRNNIYPHPSIKNKMHFLATIDNEFYWIERTEALSVAPLEIISSLRVEHLINTPFHYQIDTFGTPQSYSVNNLPVGLNFDSSTGVINGIVQQIGNYELELIVSNEYGVNTAILNLIFIDSYSNTLSTYFNGTGGNISISDFNYANSNSGGLDEDSSLSFWIYLTQYGGGARTIFCKMDNDVNNKGWVLELGERDNYLYLLAQIDYSKQSFVRSNKEIPINQWVHVVVVIGNLREANNNNFFFNGVSIGRTKIIDTIYNNNENLNSIEPLYIGAGVGGNRDFFKGYLDEISIYNKTLNSTEILNFYNNGIFDIKASSFNNNLRSWWRMGDSNIEPIITDVGNTTFNGVINGNGISFNTFVKN